MKNKYEKSLITCLLFIGMMAGFFFYSNTKSNKEIIERENKIARIGKKLDKIDIQAKAVSVYDIDLGEFIYGRNEEISLPLASLAKTMAISIALQNLPEESVIQISAEAIAQDGDTSLFSEEKWKLDDLAKLTLVSSSNDGVYAIAKNVPDIISKMNEKAKKIGMENSLFLNFTGLDISVDAGKVGAYASARDANIMAMYAFKMCPEIFGVTILPEITLKSESGYIHKIKNTDIILDKIPNLLFSKTGFTKLAGGNLSIIFKNKDGHRIAITVLGSTFDGRFSDMEKLVNALYNQNYESRN